MIIGNTVRIVGKFVTWGGSKVNPTDPVLNVYENGKILKEAIPLTEAHCIESGKYQYEYVIPDGNGSLVFEISGTVEGTPCIARINKERIFV